MTSAPFRLCEHQAVRVRWSLETRLAVSRAAREWAEAHRLPHAPLVFEGVDGHTLRARQYVGVVEAGGVCVEIYPKLDAALAQDAALVEKRAASVMGNLLWLLEESGFAGLVDAGEAAVEDGLESISDLLAWLFARRLRHQLGVGMPMEYVGRQEDLPLVRGRIEFARQAGVHFGRPDVIACAWDDFTVDTALARLLRCAVELLLARTRLAGAAADLRDALAMMEDVSRAHPLEALQGAAGIRWSRLNARWRPCHDLALAVLRGLGREMHAGGTESFVFLLDMNALFECHCARWLERRFGVAVSEQVVVGRLLAAPAPRRLRQDADFLWQTRSAVWVADAKYKRAMGEDWPRVEDVRQLICYGQLAQRGAPGKRSRLMLLHPTTGDETSEMRTTFDGQRLDLQAVRIVRRSTRSVSEENESEVSL